MIKKRTTVYLDNQLIKWLKLRSIKSDQSISEYISNVVYQDLLEEQQDLKDIKKIIKEPTLPFDQVLKELDIQDEV